MRPEGLFDIDNPRIFFSSIVSTFQSYKSDEEKDFVKLFYVLMGLNHLREWIAPGYSPKQKPKSDAQEFSQKILREPSYKTIKDLCNSMKHLSELTSEADALGGLTIDEWQDLDSVRNFDTGPVTEYQVDGEDVVVICEMVIGFYRAKWFD